MYQIYAMPCLGEVNPLIFNICLSSFAGLTFFSGWWLLISLLAENVLHYHEFFPGLFGTMALVLVNIIPTNMAMEAQYATHCTILVARTCLLLGFMIAFGALIAACYILFHDYILDSEVVHKWPGWGVFLQNLLIFLATAALKCRRSLEYY